MIIGVDCTFQIDGRILVRRIFLDGEWISVGQGRQWVDEKGRHALIMLQNDQPMEIRLRPDTMTWELLPAGRQQQTLV